LRFTALQHHIYNPSNHDPYSDCYSARPLSRVAPTENNIVLAKG